MSTASKVIIAICIAVIVGCSSYYYVQHKIFSHNNKKPDNSAQIIAANTIIFSDSGFEPSTITVKTGEIITVVNQSSEALQMDSNPHPEHTDNTDLNVGSVEQGQSKTFVVNRVGQWGYHNHLNSSQTGTIIVN